MERFSGKLVFSFRHGKFQGMHAAPGGGALPPAAAAAVAAAAASAAHPGHAHRGHGGHAHHAGARPHKAAGANSAGIKGGAKGSSELSLGSLEGAGAMGPKHQPGNVHQLLRSAKYYPGDLGKGLGAASSPAGGAGAQEGLASALSTALEAAKAKPARHHKGGGPPGGAAAAGGGGGWLGALAGAQTGGPAAGAPPAALGGGIGAPAKHGAHHGHAKHAKHGGPGGASDAAPAPAGGGGLLGGLPKTLGGQPLGAAPPPQHNKDYMLNKGEFAKAEAAAAKVNPKKVGEGWWTLKSHETDVGKFPDLKAKDRVALPPPPDAPLPTGAHPAVKHAAATL